MIADQDSSHDRFTMLRAAWLAGESLVDDRGNLCGDLNEATAKFLRRKSCRGLAADDCKAALQSAVEIAQATIRFQRANYPMTPPKAARRYELLFSLAKMLESTFPDADEVLIMAACRGVECWWDR